MPSPVSYKGVNMTLLNNFEYIFNICCFCPVFCPNTGPNFDLSGRVSQNISLETIHSAAPWMIITEFFGCVKSVNNC